MGNMSWWYQEEKIGLVKQFNVHLYKDDDIYNKRKQATTKNHTWAFKIDSHLYIFNILSSRNI